MSQSTQRLIRIGTAKSKEQQAWSEGVSIEKYFKVPIPMLRLRVAAARYGLAKEMSLAGKLVIQQAKPHYRQAISRYYYSMYHCLRAVVYIHQGGDEHQAHSELPQRLPDDFPNREIWSNQLKSAREYRNQADYEPYPRSDSYWKSLAGNVMADAVSLLQISAAYLRAKGCRV